MTMGSGETLQSYSDKYWELYNEIGRDNEHVAASTFKLRLPLHSELRDSLTMQPPKIMHQLMRRIEKHKRLEDNWLQNKGRTLLCFSIKKNLEMEAFNKDPKGRLRDRTTLAEQKG